MSEEMICKNCKYHYIEEISFDYPQSCCDKRKAVIEEWFKCNDFEYSDKYIKQLQQVNKILKENAEHNDKVVDKVNWENQLLKKENKQLKDNWNKLKEYIKETKLKEFEKSYGKRYGKTFTQAEVIVCNIIINHMQKLEEK